MIFRTLSYFSIHFKPYRIPRAKKLCSFLSQTEYCLPRLPLFPHPSLTKDVYFKQFLVFTCKSYPSPPEGFLRT